MLPNLLDVDVPDLLNYLSESCSREGSGLVENEHAVAECHQSRNRRDACSGRHAVIRFGIELAVDNIGVVISGLLEDWRELRAGTT